MTQALADFPVEAMRVGDPPLDFCLWDYVPPRAPVGDAIRGVNLLYAAANLAEEAKDPHRTVPLAIVGSVVAAGVLGLLFLIALDMVFEKRTQRREERAEKVRAENAQTPEVDDVSVFPMAMPMIAGPGSIATIMLLTARAQGTEQTLVVLAAMGAVLVLTLVALIAAGHDRAFDAIVDRYRRPLLPGVVGTRGPSPARGAAAPERAVTSRSRPASIFTG